MPHLFVDGMVGAGKTNLMRAITTSLVFRRTPDEVRFALADPKGIEFEEYDDTPYLWCERRCDPGDIVRMFERLVAEAAHRNRLFRREGALDITTYNATRQRVPYIVAIIDEVADLLSCADPCFHTMLSRLLATGPAVGIHVIAATQIPSSAVALRDWFPRVVAMRAVNRFGGADARMAGAEKLLGNGDMLVRLQDDDVPRRVHAPEVHEDELQALGRYLREERAVVGRKRSKPGSLYERAKELVLRSQKCSSGWLERKLCIDAAEANVLIAELEAEGIVGPPMEYREVILRRPRE
jgi:S-DNA-T family DNA segregation ATPase FtsK/SpoIIIE